MLIFNYNIYLYIHHSLNFYDANKIFEEKKTYTNILKLLT